MVLRGAWKEEEYGVSMEYGILFGVPGSELQEKKLTGIPFFCRLRSSRELSFLNQLSWCVPLKNQSGWVKTVCPLFSICKWRAGAGSFRFGRKNLSPSTKPQAKRCFSVCLREADTRAAGRWGMRGRGDEQIASGTFWIQPKAVPLRQMRLFRPY